jgi:CubicO group peptidase (beta-lactamase class C family)
MVLAIKTDIKNNQLKINRLSVLSGNIMLGRQVLTTLTMLLNYFSPVGPGAALAVAVEGKAPHIECCGLADIQQGIEITPDTVFDLASASKTFTATGIMQLIEQGCLELTAPVGNYLPLVETSKARRPITIKDLLSHTSGLPDYLESGMYAAVDQVSPDYVASQLPAWSWEARPGENHNYCNTNYFVLSKVIESITGLGYAEFVRLNLLNPFGLRSTFVLGAVKDPTRIVKGYRNSGYGLSLVEPSDEFELETLGDGGVLSSLSDLIRWQSLLWNGEIISKQSLALMQTPGQLESGEHFEYGLGLQVERREGGHIWCGHGGSWTSTTIMIGRYMNERTSVIVLSNEVMAPVERISQRALEMSRK